MLRVFLRAHILMDAPPGLNDPGALFYIESVAWSDRSIYTARRSETRELIAVGIHYTHRQSARVWDDAALERSMRNLAGRPLELFDVDVPEVLRRVSKAADEATTRLARRQNGDLVGSSRFDSPD
jgi:hypothetical protein